MVTESQELEKALGALKAIKRLPKYHATYPDRSVRKCGWALDWGDVMDVIEEFFGAHEEQESDHDDGVYRDCSLSAISGERIHRKEKAMNAIDKEIAEFAKAFFLICVEDGKAPTVRYDREYKNVKVWADNSRGGATVEFITDRNVGAYKAANRIYTLIKTKPEGTTID